MEEAGKSRVKPEIDVRFFEPPTDLARCFTSFYLLEVRLPPGEIVTDYLQPEWSNLRFFESDPPTVQRVGSGEVINSPFMVSGPSCGSVRFSIGTTRMWGIGLMPLGWARFVKRPASDFSDGAYDGQKTEAFAPFRPLSKIFSARHLSDEEKVDAVCNFFRKIADPPRDENRIISTQEAMVDPQMSEVKAFAEQAGLTVRTLERLCMKHFGYPPSMLLRRQRMMRSLAAFMVANRKTWTQAIDGTYHDQAHFVREFQTFMRMSPTDYSSMPHPVLSAFMERRQKIWGSPFQTLDSPGRRKDRAPE